MHIAVHPANNKDDDEDEDGKDDDDNEEEEEGEDGDVVASNTSPQTQLINIAESENKITRRGSFKAKQSQICCFVYQHYLWWARLNPQNFQFIKKVFTFWAVPEKFYDCSLRSSEILRCNYNWKMCLWWYCRGYQNDRHQGDVDHHCWRGVNHRNEDHLLQTSSLGSQFNL